MNRTNGTGRLQIAASSSAGIVSFTMPPNRKSAASSP
jgi:hypothetical protein